MGSCFFFFLKKKKNTEKYDFGWTAPLKDQTTLTVSNLFKRSFILTRSTEKKTLLQLV